MFNRETILKNLNSPQFLIDTLNRKPHHIKITPLQPRTTYVANPFLNTIGASFVKRLIMIYIITDFHGFVYRKSALCTNSLQKISLYRYKITEMITPDGIRPGGCHSRLKIPPSRALLAARMYLLVSRGSTLRRGVVAVMSGGHSR